jgi:hypothetical protein
MYNYKGSATRKHRIQICVALLAFAIAVFAFGFYFLPYQLFFNIVCIAAFFALILAMYRSRFTELEKNSIRVKIWRGVEYIGVLVGVLLIGAIVIPNCARHRVAGPPRKVFDYAMTATWDSTSRQFNVNDVFSLQIACATTPNGNEDEVSWAIKELDMGTEANAFQIDVGSVSPINEMKDFNWTIADRAYKYCVQFELSRSRSVKRTNSYSYFSESSEVYVDAPVFLSGLGERDCQNTNRHVGKCTLFVPSGFLIASNISDSKSESNFDNGVLRVRASGAIPLDNGLKILHTSSFGEFPIINSIVTWKNWYDVGVPQVIFSLVATFIFKTILDVVKDLLITAPLKRMLSKNAADGDAPSH